MKLIEAMKSVKSTLRKMSDLREKLAKYCSDLDIMAPTYGSTENQKDKINEWLQTHHDLALKLTTLKKNIQRTNLATEVAIRIGEENITRTIAEWVIRRREIVNLELSAWGALTDRDQALRLTYVRSGINKDEMKSAKVRFYFDPELRDKRLEILKGEKENIDQALEIVNVNTEFIEN